MSKLHVLVTGGAGYVGAVLVPKLLAQGHRVTVLDLYIFGDQVLKAVSGHPGLREVKGDIRDRRLLERELTGVDAVIHLACISNDPSFELNPELGKSINYDAFLPLVEIAKDKGVRRFIYASSSSVYGIKDEENVTEDLPLQPLTDYSKYKALCEEVLLKAQAPGFTSLILRPATVCGYSPRLRLDLAVNILTNLAVNTGRITVFGGAQKRPNIHIEDVTDLYVRSLEWPEESIDGQIFNAGYENHTVSQLADMVAGSRGPREGGHRDHAHRRPPLVPHLVGAHQADAGIRAEPQRRGSGARPLAPPTARDAIPNSMTDKRYYNIKTMLEVKL